MAEFTDKVVLVTGAGLGVGRAIAQGFAAQSAIIAANDINPVNLDETMRRITSAGGRGKDYIFDTAKKMPVQAMVSEILDDWERIDVLVNSAAVEPHAPLLDMDEWDWRRTMDVNLNGPFFTIQTVGRVMREQGGGVMLNIGSTAGRAHGLKDRAAYVASQMGLIGLTRQAAHELAAYHIRVNAICPGIVETGRRHELSQDEELSRWRLEDIPAGRPGKPGDIVGLALFLCSEASAYITGQSINVDGGLVMC